MDTTVEKLLIKVGFMGQFVMETSQSHSTTIQAKGARTVELILLTFVQYAFLILTLSKLRISGTVVMSKERIH